MSVAKTKPRWERRKDSRPAELLAAALDLFVERGYASTRLEDVALRAGVSKGTLYLYFESKEDLFKAMIRESLSPVLDEAEQLVDAYTGSSAALFRDFITGWWTRVGETKLSGITKLMMAEAANFPEVARFYHDEIISRSNQLIVRMLERGIARAEFRPIDVRHANMVIVAPMLMLMLWKHSFGLCRPEQISSTAYLDCLIDLLTNGLIMTAPEHNGINVQKRNKLGIALIVVLLAAAAGGALISKKKQTAVPVAAKTPQALEFLPSDLAQVKTAELRQTLALSGALRAVNQVSVKARVAGDVLDVLVREGEPVQAGQVLVKMDIREYQSKMNQAAGALAAARGQLEIASKARDSNRALLEKNFISKNAFDNAESQYAIARANVDSARAALDVTQKAAADTVIRAPISGLISSRTVQPGEKVSADNRLLDVVDLRQMELEAAVPTSEITSVSLNQEVEVRFAGVPRPVPGKVVRINPATQAGSRSVLVYVQIDNPQNQLKVGMFGEAQLTLTKKSGVLAAPQTAIRNDAGSSFVYAVENGLLAKKPVRIGMNGFAENEPAVEILDGVQNGTRIIRNNLGELLAGTPVKIVGTAGPGNGNNGGNNGATNGGGVSAPANVDLSPAPATAPAGGNVATR